MNPNRPKNGMITKHGLLMLLCCLIPVVAIVAIRLLNVPLNGVLYVGLVLLCPLSHILLMGGMAKHRHGSANEDKVIEGEIVSRSSEPAE